MSERVWRVGHEYRDRGGVKFTDDELLKWLATPAGSIANSGGIRFKDPIGNVVVDAESSHDRTNPFTAEDTHEVVFGANKELSNTRVALPA